MLDDEYYRRIEAIQFTMYHDDGKKLDDISKADIVLLGVSRTNKTPTSIYLGNVHPLPIIVNPNNLKQVNE